MKRLVLWGVGAAVAGTAMTLVLSAREPSKPSKAAEPSPAAAATPGTMADRVVFTFASNEQMQQFAELWQQRQTGLTRLAVLQSYVAQEDAGVAKLNQQLESQYHLQLNKHYTLDTDRHVLIERWEAPQASPSASATPWAPAAAAPAAASKP